MRHYGANNEFVTEKRRDQPFKLDCESSDVSASLTELKLIQEGFD